MSVHEDLIGDIDWSEYHVVGTCQDIEKPYLRLTSVSYSFISVFHLQNYPMEFSYISGSALKGVMSLNRTLNEVQIKFIKIRSLHKISYMT
jgi:hypothetical protein